MQRIQSFSPIIQSSCHTLILGSMPGKMSLTEFQYYAHPRNAFWHIMGELFGAGFNVPYERRLEILLTNGIALWDVIENCTRGTSLDSDIDESSIATNDFHHLLHNFPKIRRIVFNGSKAEQTFYRYVHPTITEVFTDIHLHRLTSTSPANARYSVSDKIAIWRSYLLSPQQ